MVDATPEPRSALSTADYVEIQQLYARYAFSVDLQDVDAWMACWTDDGALVTTAGKRTGGADQRRAMMLANGDVPEERGYHWVGNVVIDAAEHGANGRCYLMHLFAPDGPARLRYALYYQDELVKRDGRWLFRLRTLHKVGAGVADPDARDSERAAS
jgi:hypothetical protein